MKHFANFVDAVFENKDQVANFYGDIKSDDSYFNDREIIEMLRKIFNKINFDVDESFIKEKIENNSNNSEFYVFARLYKIIYCDLNDDIIWTDIVDSFEDGSITVYVTKNGKIYVEYC